MQINWDDSLLTGNATIDLQHRELFRRINLLLQSCKRGEGAESVAEAMRFLEVHVLEHFGDEERLQAETHYAQFKAHKAEHEQFLVEFGRLKASLRAKGSDFSLAIELLATLVDWVGNHITETDKALCQHLKKIKPAET